MKPTPTKHPAAFYRMRAELRGRMQSKQEELVENVANILSAKNLKEQRAAQAAVRRNEKSLALLTSKFICDHNIEMTTMTRNGAQLTYYRCSICKASAVSKP